MHGVGMGMDMHMRNRCRVEHWPPEHAAILPIDVTSINVDETRTKRKQKLVKWQHATKNMAVCISRVVFLFLAHHNSDISCHSRKKINVLRAYHLRRTYAFF